MIHPPPRGAGYWRAERPPGRAGPGSGVPDRPRAPFAVGGRVPEKVKMEEILRKLQKEASGSKYKAIKESCTWALGKRAERDAGTCRPAGRRCSPAAGGPRAGAGIPVPGGLSPSICFACISRSWESCLGR